MLGILVEYSRGLSREIAAAGGRLKVGCYTRRVPADDPAGRLRELTEARRREPLMDELFPFGDSAWAAFDSLAARESAAGPVATRFAPDLAGRLPKLHRKTQFIGTGEAVRAMARSPEAFRIVHGVVERSFTASRDSLWGVPADDDAARAMAGFAAVDQGFPPELRDHRLFYMTVGSVNKDSRSNFLDGETQFIVSDVWGLGTWIDFMFLFGSTEWIDSQEQLEQHFPAYSGFEHRIGRFLRRIL
jgi:hypothetical protein